MFWGKPSISSPRLHQFKKNVRDGGQFYIDFLTSVSLTFPGLLLLRALPMQLHFLPFLTPLSSPPRSTDPIHKHHVLWVTITASIIPSITASQTYPWQSSWTAWNFKMKHQHLTEILHCKYHPRGVQVSTHLNHEINCITANAWHRTARSRSLTIQQKPNQGLLSVCHHRSPPQLLLHLTVCTHSSLLKNIKLQE